MAVNLPLKLVRLSLIVLADRKREDFIQACKEPEKYQMILKERILKKSRISFPDKPTNYHDYAGQINLTQEKVTFFETTSGSTGNKKHIPYTKPLLKSFQNMFLLWAHDIIFHSGLDFSSGKFFMSVSPQIGESSNDDRKYLSPFLNFLLGPFLASDPNHHYGKTTDDFFLKVSRDLIKNSDLEIISIWSPTYLLSILEFMKENKEKLGLKTTEWKKVWPRLKLISCWTHAQAKTSAIRLQNEFPHVLIQPKGLLMTEAPVTVPWSEARGNIPLVTETYLEFLDGENILGLHQLEIGKSYIVLTSQFNGFLRYNTQDEVKVTGMYYKVPVLEFTGRCGQYSDLAGEKLSETLIRETFSEHHDFYLIVPDESGPLPRYQIFSEVDYPHWEKDLRTIHHYHLARNLNQLHELKIFHVKNLKSLYLKFFQEEGMNLGDIKEKVLLNNPIQAQRFLAWIHKELQSSH